MARHGDAPARVQAQPGRGAGDVDETCSPPIPRPVQRRQCTPRGAPDADLEIGRTKRQLAKALHRARPRVSAGTRAALVEIVAHWQHHRLRGARTVHPGLDRIAGWAGVQERQARNIVRQLEAWNVIEAVAHASGGAGLAPEYVVHGRAIVRALQAMGAGVTEALAHRLTAHDILPGFKRDISQENQTDSAKKRGQFHVTEQEPAPEHNTGKRGHSKGAEKGAIIAPRKEETTMRVSRPDPEQVALSSVEASPRPPAPAGGCEVAETMVPPASPSRPSCDDGRNVHGTGIEGDEIRAREAQLDPDARTLLALIRRGPTTYGAAATALAWGATRAWQAEARLMQAGAIRHDGIGRAHAG